MRLLLDTHVVLWWLGGNRALSPLAERQLDDRSNEVLISAVVVWEIAIKRSLGKLRAPRNIVAAVFASDAVKLPVTVEHAAGVEGLPPHHRDPFDRLLVAQAMIEGASLVSSDAALAPYGVPLVW